MERGVLRRLKIEINDVVVGEVGVIKHPTTQMVESVIAHEYVAAVCELPLEKASSALSDAMKANPFLGQVFSIRILYIIILFVLYLLFIR